MIGYACGLVSLEAAALLLSVSIRHALTSTELLACCGPAMLACPLSQAFGIHKEFSVRRQVLQQQLAYWQQQSRLSVNPLLLQLQREPTDVATTASAAGQPQPDGAAAAAVADAGVGDGEVQQHQQALRPLPPALPQVAAAATTGDAPTAASSLAVAGPHKVTPQGNVILLPDDSIQDKMVKLLAQIEEFTAPR